MTGSDEKDAKRPRLDIQRNLDVQPDNAAAMQAHLLEQMALAQARQKELEAEREAVNEFLNAFTPFNRQSSLDNSELQWKCKHCRWVYDNSGAAAWHLATSKDGRRCRKIRILSDIFSPHAIAYINRLKHQHKLRIVQQRAVQEKLPRIQVIPSTQQFNETVLHDKGVRDMEPKKQPSPLKATADRLKDMYPHTPMLCEAWFAIERGQEASGILAYFKQAEIASAM